jgi:hypothetical protein
MSLGARNSQENTLLLAKLKEHEKRALIQDETRGRWCVGRGCVVGGTLKTVLRRVRVCSLGVFLSGRVFLLGMVATGVAVQWRRLTFCSALLTTTSGQIALRKITRL